MTRLLESHIVFFLGFTLIHVTKQTVYNCSSTSPCGCSANVAVTTKIVGGEPAASQTWGWAASLRYSSSNGHFCGGSIISRSHVLTAAHCTAKLASPTSVLVYVGSIFLSDKVQMRTVSKIYMHPNYSASNYVNDIAILKLSFPLDLSQSSVNIVCLPNVSTSVLKKQEYPESNTNLVAIGWGYTSEGSGVISNVLGQVTITVVAADSVYCKNVNIADSSKQFCAGSMPDGGKDTCQGDSGSPLLMFTSDNIWQQVGITSSGYGCARAHYPGLYTRVAAYESWISDAMNSANKMNHIFACQFYLLIYVIIYLTD